MRAKVSFQSYMRGNVRVSCFRLDFSSLDSVDVPIAFVKVQSDFFSAENWLKKENIRKDFPPILISRFSLFKCFLFLWVARVSLSNVIDEKNVTKAKKLKFSKWGKWKFSGKKLFQCVLEKVKFPWNRKSSLGNVTPRFHINNVNKTFRENLLTADHLQSGGDHWKLCE